MEVFISRAQHDRLIDRFPVFMAGSWTKFNKRWSLAGVHVKLEEGEGPRSRFFDFLLRQIETPA